MSRHRLLLLITMAASLMMPSGALSARREHDQNRELLEQAIIRLTGPETEIRYFSAYVDLNGDGRDEAVVYLLGPGICGSSGCPTLVFLSTGPGKDYELVTCIEITRPPIIAARSKTKGWRDLIVFVRGGGILEGFNMLLPFDGASYPESPFLEPAHPFKGRVRGDVLITRHSYDEGRSLVEP